MTAHWSSCAVHNEPALPAGECDCGGMPEGDALVAETVERELPGFWAFLKARHPKFAAYGAPDAVPLGFIPAAEVYEAMAETIPAYVRALRACE